jgi:hypothetical protein
VASRDDDGRGSSSDTLDGREEVTPLSGHQAAIPTDKKGQEGVQHCRLPPFAAGCRRLPPPAAACRRLPPPGCLGRPKVRAGGPDGARHSYAPPSRRVALVAAGGKAGLPEDGAEAVAGEDDYVFYCYRFFHLPLHSFNTPTSGLFYCYFHTGGFCLDKIN